MASTNTLESASPFATATAKYATFYLEKELLGIEVSRVQEIIRYQEMTRVPLAPPEYRGLVNLREQIVPAIDLRKCLEMPPAPAGLQPMNVIIRTQAEEAVSLLVDEVGDIVETGEERHAAVPETLQGTAREFIRGVCQLEECLLVLLDVDKLIHAVTSQGE